MTAADLIVENVEALALAAFLFGWVCAMLTGLMFARAL